MNSFKSKLRYRKVYLIVIRLSFLIKILFSNLLMNNQLLLDALWLNLSFIHKSSLMPITINTSSYIADQ